MLWGNFLHLYQPVTQKTYWIDRITKECYRPLFEGLVENPDLRLSININSVLVELLDEHGHNDVIDNIKTLLEREQIELTGSAKYHPLLVFMPEYEQIRQIQLNDEAHRRYFGDAYKPKGFFPPEMAFSFDVAKTVADLGFEWIIIDELSFPDQAPVDYSRRYVAEGAENLSLYFRERGASWNILSGQLGTPKMLEDSLKDRFDTGEYLLTAMDGETFGHHRPGLQSLLFDLNQTDKIKTCLLSDIAKEYPEPEVIRPQASTWALMQKDLERNMPFSRWYDDDNEIHVLQWKLTKMAIELYASKHRDSQELTEDPLDQSLQSDQYWWASARPWWSIEMIERGAKNLFDAICAAPDVDEGKIAEAKEMYRDIVFTAFDWQRSGKVDELAHSEDEEVRQRTDSGIPHLPKEEVDKMIANLRVEIERVVKKEEFERAAQLRDRIKELEGYADDVELPQTSSEGTQEWED